jgi:hypothetical protein
VTAPVRFRDVFKLITPWWLSDRPEQGKTVGYRYLWSMIAPLDALMEGLLQGIQAAYPGLGTPTALPFIGRARGILRGQADTDDDYAAKLRAWLDRWESAGSARGLAREIHEYLANHPRIRIVNRAGHWLTLEQDGTITETDAAWNWDGTSNPERAGYWSELWVIVYPTQWAKAAKWGTGEKWGGGLGFGHDVTRKGVDALTGLFAEWKSAHSKIRAVIWTSDATLFDPSNPTSLPNGTWGQWGGKGNGPRTGSGRNISTCRYWEL